MKSWIVASILGACVLVALAAGPEVTKTEKEQQREKVREKQAHFIKRAKEIKADQSMSEEERQEELHKLREHAMMFMGPHAILPHALMQPSPIAAIEEKRQALIKAIEDIIHSDLGFEEKKVQLEVVRDQFKAEVSEIHRHLKESDVAKVRSTLQKKTQADAYKRMLHDGIRGVREAGVRGRAFDDALYRGIQKVTAGLKNKELGEFRQKLTEKRMKSAGGKAKRDVKLSVSRPDM